MASGTPAPAVAKGPLPTGGETDGPPSCEKTEVQMSNKGHGYIHYSQDCRYSTGELQRKSTLADAGMGRLTLYVPS